MLFAKVKLSSVIFFYIFSLKFTIQSEKIDDNNWKNSEILLFNDSSKIKTTDLYECKVIGVEESKTVKVINTRDTPEHEYQYFSAPKSECFSFKVRSKQNVQISLSPMPMIKGPMIEVILMDTFWGGFHSAIRRDYNHREQNPLISTPNIVNEEEFKGFWIKWNKSGLIQVGYEGNSTPFMVYAEPNPFLIDFVGIRTTLVHGTWILEEPYKCPEVIETSQRLKTECRKAEEVKIDARIDY